MAEQQKFTVKVSKKYDKETRIAIGLEIIDSILARTAKGKDKKNKDFAGYSKSYTSSFDFKLAGKGKKPNLNLSGEMMNSVTLLETDEGEITIGIPDDDEFNNSKAEGNIKGTYGGAPKRGKKRDFMGIPRGDLNAIKSQFSIKTKKDRESTSNKVFKALLANEASQEIAGNFLNVEELSGEL